MNAFENSPSTIYKGKKDEESDSFLILGISSYIFYPPRHYNVYKGKEYLDSDNAICINVMALNQKWNQSIKKDEQIRKTDPIAFVKGIVNINYVGSVFVNIDDY